MNAGGESIIVDMPSQRIMPEPQGRLTETDIALLRQPDTMTELATAAGLLREKLPVISTMRLRKASPGGIDFQHKRSGWRHLCLYFEKSAHFPKHFLKRCVYRKGQY